jgi:DNA repair protein RadD
VIDPRAYQTRGINAARQAIRDGRRAPLLVSPCGSGKTVMGAAIGFGTIARGNRLLWLAHRRELIDQARKHLAEAGIGSDAPVTVESFQTLAARDPATWPAANVVIEDECQHVNPATPEWFKVSNWYRSHGSVCVGLTATPARGDGAPMGDAYDCIITVASVKELQALGWLVEYVVFGPNQAVDAMAESPVDAMARYAPAGRALVFARDVKHARNLAAAFSARGFPALCVEGKMADRDPGIGVDKARDAAFARFRSGEVRVLTGVHVFTEGLDVPVADVAILARRVGHPGAYIQATSRVGRPSPGKTRGLVLDLLGSSHECGLPDDDREYSLEGRAISRGDSLEPLRQCPACGGCFRTAEFKAARCPRCGYETPGRPDPAVRRAAIGRILEGHTADQRAKRWAALVAEGQRLGHKRGWAYFRFRAMYHSDPPRTGATNA